MKNAGSSVGRGSGEGVRSEGVDIVGVLGIDTLVDCGADTLVELIIFVVGSGDMLRFKSLL